MSARPTPVSGLEAVTAYSVPRPKTPVELHLDGNEGLVPDAKLLAELSRADPELVRRYPDPAPLSERLARRFDVAPERVLITAGADEALDRLCRALLAPGRELILPEPTFVMIPRFAKLARGEIVSVPWKRGPYPLDAVLERVGPQTAMIAVVTPNNPTGAVATAADLARLAEAAPHAVVLLDHAYVEFADEDLTQLALGYPNVVVLRTFSKALGLAGLRVGFALGPPEIIAWMRAAAGPYSVASLSLALAHASLEGDSAKSDAFVGRIREERDALATLLGELGANPQPSQANFVHCEFTDEVWVHEALAGLGVGVRRFPDEPRLAGALRITCPGSAQGFERLEHGLRCALAPEALLFDLDGVLADVSGSYRRAILETAQLFGVTLAPADVTAAKAAGDANNDWVLTQKLLERAGVQVDLELVTQRFEELYQGTPEAPGLRREERLLVPRELLERLSKKLPLAVVTGRPRQDLEAFLEQAQIGPLFQAHVCMEDGPLKPDPAPVRLALERLGATRAWMIGDTPDDIRAARLAGVVPLGILAPADTGDGDLDEAAAGTEGMAAALLQAGAGRVLDHLEELETLL